MPIPALSARERRFHNSPEFGRRIGAPNRTPSVLGIDATHEWSDPQAEKHEGQWMADEIENDEPSAGTSDVADHIDEIVLRKMMAEVHTVRYIGKRQVIAPCIGLNDGNGCRNRRVRIDLSPDHSHAKTSPHFVHHETRR